MSNMNTVDAGLYDFLKENETGLHEEGKEIIAYVHIHYSDVAEFVEIVGSHPFDDGGMKATMCIGTLVVELNDIIASDGHYLQAYKKCFPPDDWERYEEQIKAQEAD